MDVRSLEGYSSWGRKELDRTEQLSSSSRQLFTQHLNCMYIEFTLYIHRVYIVCSIKVI